MIQNMDLGFGESPLTAETPGGEYPPWETITAPTADSDPTSGQSLVMGMVGEAAGDGDTPPWEEDRSLISDVVDLDDSKEELEIYKKAERFKQLKLLSGNNVNGAVDSYIADNYGTLGKQRLALAKHVMKLLGYRPSPDVMLMLSCTKHARVVIATAGAGKTTSLQVEILIDKMLDKALGIGNLTPELIEGTTVTVPRILYLNYNKHNVKPIEQKHFSVCTALNKTLKAGDAVDTSLESSTVHAFCHKWLTAFTGDVDLPQLVVIDDNTKQSVWDAIIQPRWKRYYPDEGDCTVGFAQLDELYTYKAESMLDWDEFFETAKFLDSHLKADFVKGCISRYDSMKRSMKLMDFTDYLVLMIETLRSRHDLREKLRRRYRLIIADENQDFTRLMNELLLELYDPELNQLVVVGDPDQTLYEFRGVSPDNVVNLSERLSDVQLLGLDTNYRCPDGIVAGAKKILDLNVLRFEKPINTVRTGGVIVKHPLMYAEDQHASVIKLLKDLSPAEWENTVITYRNNQSAMVMLEEMYYAGIPFNVLDGYRPFSNPVFRHLNTAIKALKQKDDVELNKCLFRFLPMSREMWEKLLEDNRMKRHNHLHDIVADWASLPQGTPDALEILFQISNIIDTSAVSDYIAKLIKLYRLYFFDFKLRSEKPNAPEQGSAMLQLERALNYFNRPLTWDYMQKEQRERNVNREEGVSVSTFHGLKGLEFNNVIAIDFSETIFPNFANIEMRYPPNTAIAEKEAENRLCYVLVTRAIKALHLFYPKGDPSLYVSILTQDSAITKEEQGVQEMSLGSVTAPNELLTSKLDFIKRLTQDRRR